LSSVFEGDLAIIWADGTDGTNSSPTPSEIMRRVTQDFSSSQQAAVRQVSSPSEIPQECPQNFNLFSECFAAVAFYDIPPPPDDGGDGSATTTLRNVNYTLRADGGLFHIDVEKHSSDFEIRLLPLQWAIDRVRLLHSLI
jgi:ATP-binding cassette, subfamily A (ABC1), member 3